MDDDDDWGFDEESVEINTYDSTDNDLSSEINVGHRTRDLRLLAEIDPETLADQADISVNDLLAMEAGMLHMDRDTAQQVANALSVKLTDVWS